MRFLPRLSLLRENVKLSCNGNTRLHVVLNMLLVLYLDAFDIQFFHSLK